MTTQPQENVPQLAIRRIYVKDVSFESPMSPDIFNQTIKPTLKIDLKTQHKRLDENHYDVTLEITINAHDGDKVIFVVEVEQGGIFFIKGISGDHLGEILGIFCPTTLFPYLRETVDQLTVKGGFPPLMLAPINFEQMYHSAKQQSAANTPPQNIQ